MRSFKEFIKTEWETPGGSLTGYSVFPPDNLGIGGGLGQGGGLRQGETPAYGIGMPQVTRRRRVTRLDYRNRLVEITLEDGTRLAMTRAQFERIGGDPVVPGKSVMTVVFQRNPGDQSDEHSQILKAYCDNLPKVRQLS